MENDKQSLAAIYGHILRSFGTGILHLWGAEAGFARLVCALLQYRITPSPATADNPYRDVLVHLNKIDHSSYASLTHVTNLSHHIYATSLLDSFLTDTTVFLFLAFPQSIGKNQQIPLSSLLSHSSKYQAITEAALKRAREISYLSIMDRIDSLRQGFGLEIILSEATTSSLVRHSSERNAAVHDQSMVQLALDDDGQVTSQPKQNELSTIDSEAIRHAAHTYITTATAVAKAVMSQALKCPDHPELKSLLKRAENIADGDNL